MTNDRSAVKAARYTWDPDRPTRREGIRVSIGNSFLFIPWENAVDAANQIIDLYEQQENTA